MIRGSGSRATMNTSSIEDDPVFDGDEEYITRGQHWRLQQSMRRRFEQVEQRLDNQFDDFHNNMQIVSDQTANLQESIANLGHHRRHHRSSSSSSTQIHVSRRVHPSSSSTSHEGHHHRRHARSPRHHNNEEQGQRLLAK